MPNLNNLETWRKERKAKRTYKPRAPRVPLIPKGPYRVGVYIWSGEPTNGELVECSLEDIGPTFESYADAMALIENLKDAAK